MQQHFRKGAIVETFAANYHHLDWFYPRFPSWVKVRRSKIEAGTQWIPYETEKVGFPPLYSGREAPDYIVLSLPITERIRVDSEEDRILKPLYQGNMGYTVVATFKARTIVRIRSLQVNPRIDIFASRSLTLPSSRQ